MQQFWAVIREHCNVRRRTLITLLVLLTLVALHPLILWMLAWPLQTAYSSSTTDYYCVHGRELGLDGFQTLDRAAEWHRKTGGTILLMLPRASRLVEIGAALS